MASSGHSLQQQRGSLEARIKLLVNPDLKEICKAYNYQVSGTKAVLQKRCIEILTDIVKRGDQTDFNDLNYRVAHHGQAPPPRSHTSGPVAGSSNYQNTNAYHHNNQSMSHRPTLMAGRSAAASKFFKSSPFYDVLETIVPLEGLPGGLEMPQNRHTVKVNLVLSPDQATRLKSDPDLRLLLYCGLSQGMTVLNPVDVAFPNQLEVKINGDDVRANFKGLKSKPGSTKPADITDKVRKANNYPNQMSVTYALTTKRFAFVVHLVKHINANVLTERIKAGLHGGGIISKRSVLDEMSKANADPDIAATSQRMSLKDPISTLRITLPVRSTVCKHNQCFDGAMFMQLQEQAPQWSCPLCNQSVSYQQLCIDKYFEEILQTTSSSIEKVVIEPTGEWRVLKEEDDKPPAGQSSKGGRASYDDDFDDDLIEVDPKPKPWNGLGASHLSSLLSPASSSGFAMNTPPLSSRGASAAPSASSARHSNKRPASSVIDLTLSDDEDEPPRPAKRQTTSSTHQGSSTYSTPSSLPDRFSSYSSGLGHGTDHDRPSSNATKPTHNGGSGVSINDYGNHQFRKNAAGSGTDIPFRTGNSSSPGYGSFGSISSLQQQHGSFRGLNNSDAPAHSERSAGTPSMSSMTRPPPSTSPSQTGMPNIFQLPPMQTRPTDDYGGWGFQHNSYL